MSYIRSGRSLSSRRGIQFLPGRLAYSTGSHQWSISSAVLWSKRSRDRASEIGGEAKNSQGSSDEMAKSRQSRANQPLS